MKYVCLGYLNPQAMDARPQAEIDRIMADCAPHMEILYRDGAVQMDLGLSNETKHLRRVGGRVMVTDGPFAETKELLGSVFVIEADSWEEAVRIALLHPTTQVPEGETLGWRLEVRPVHYSKD